MHKIAVIFESSPFDRKGLFNAVHNRILHLKNTGECSIDAFCIHSWDNALTRRMRSTPHISSRQDSVDIDGISYRMLWYDFSIIDHIAVSKLHIPPLFFTRFIKKHLDLLSGYDLIIAHSFTGGLFARAASECYGIPYIVNWHGSDIHTHPWRNSLILEHTRDVMAGASCNCFVSSALKDASEKILQGIRKEILYNGVSESFRTFPEEERLALRNCYGVKPGTKVVAFVGSIVQVKNVRSLHPIFNAVRLLYSGPLQFWMVGDGKLRGEIEPAMKNDPDIDVRFWGNLPAEEMPSVMNCIDLMILPSLNEGLPLVCAEAIRCGADVIGSDVGGISEVIGSENVIPLDKNFVNAISLQAVRRLLNPTNQVVPSELSWYSTAAEELALIKEVVM